MEKITSRSNLVCLHIRKLGKSKSYRDEHGQFLCDGIKLLDEAVSCGAEIDIILTSEALERSFPKDTRVYYADESVIDSLSPLKNSQGLLFICRIVSIVEYDLKTGTHLLLDNIQDPGNVGTIVRTANAFGIKSIILTDGSADLYNPKTIRASMGAVFKQDVIHMSISDIKDLKKNGVKFIGSSNDDSSVDIKEADLKDSVIILGNEGQGISEDLLVLCDEMIRIPVSPDCESINVAVAASIIMWESVSSGRQC